MKTSEKIYHGNKEIIPAQEKGSETGASHEVEANNNEHAKEIFAEAVKKLLDINSWHKMAGAGAKFFLTDKSGIEKTGKPQKGDLIKIDLPGPGTTAGDGFDWVEIEEFENSKDEAVDKEFFAFRTRPVKNPDSAGKDVAHFYTSETTSTFLVERVGKKILAAEIGRNEIDNTETTAVLDKIRNKMVATGAKMGVSSLQWKFLVKGILDDAEKH